MTSPRAGVPFFHKQNGGRNKKAAGRLLDGVAYDAMPPVASRAIPPAKARRDLARQLVPEAFRVAGELEPIV